MDNVFADIVDERGAQADITWRVVGTAAGVAGAIGAKAALNRFRSDDKNGFVEAVLWATALAVGATLGRVLAQRAVVLLWRRGRSRLARGAPRTAVAR